MKRHEKLILEMFLTLSGLVRLFRCTTYGLTRLNRHTTVWDFVNPRPLHNRHVFRPSPTEAYSYFFVLNVLKSIDSYMRRLGEMPGRNSHDSICTETNCWIIRYVSMCVANYGIYQPQPYLWKLTV